MLTWKHLILKPSEFICLSQIKVGRWMMDVWAKDANYQLIIYSDTVLCFDFLKFGLL